MGFTSSTSILLEVFPLGFFIILTDLETRLIIYALNQIPKKSDEEKVKFLREKGIIEKDRKDVHESIIKASRRARNFFSHDIKVFPTPSEALSLLGDAIGSGRAKKTASRLKIPDVERFIDIMTIIMVANLVPPLDI